MTVYTVSEAEESDVKRPGQSLIMQVQNVLRAREGTVDPSTLLATVGATYGLDLARRDAPNAHVDAVVAGLHDILEEIDVDVEREAPDVAPPDAAMALAREVYEEEWLFLPRDPAWRERVMFVVAFRSVQLSADRLPARRGASILIGALRAAHGRGPRATPGAGEARPYGTAVATAPARTPGTRAKVGAGVTRAAAGPAKRAIKVPFDPDATKVTRVTKTTKTTRVTKTTKTTRTKPSAKANKPTPKATKPIKKATKPIKKATKPTTKAKQPTPKAKTPGRRRGR